MFGTIKEHYKWGFAALVASLAFATMEGGMAGLFTAVLLVILEVSLSFDNAVVNAKDLTKLTEGQKRWFLTWGMVVSVLGMRLLFPILIVAATAAVSPWIVAGLAISDPAAYGKLLNDSHVLVGGFGGAFLLMVFLHFIMNKEKDVHWVIGIEHLLAKFGHLNFTALLPIVEAVVAAAIVYGISTMLPAHEASQLFYSGLFGIAVFSIVSAIKHIFEAKSEGTGSAVSSGAAVLAFMEVRDASFSFDGVIGAFALTNDIVIIMLGLGVGALFVREMTIHMAKKNVVASFQYLEHGAHWAIGALAAVMLLGPAIHISEVVTGLIGAVFIGAALVCSLIYKRRNRQQLPA